MSLLPITVERWAEIMQELKDVMREVDGWRNLTPSQREALDMIQHKIGRILNGDQTYDDSWKDIAGYATLIVNELNGEIK
jgi:DNA repair ATPase RecN